MAWVRLDDHFDEHPKLAAAGALGIALWTTGLAYCNRNLTDGLIPSSIAHRLISTEGLYDASGRELHCRDIAEQLVDCGLWERDGDDYRVHDYLEFQPSRDQVLEEREKARVRMQRRRSSREVRANNKRSSDAPKPKPKPINHQTSSDGGADAPARRKRPAAPPPAAAEAYRQVCERYPRRETYPLLAEKVADDEASLGTFRRAISLWVAAKHDPNNVAGILDWYGDLREGRNPNPRPPHANSRASPSGNGRTAQPLERTIADLPKGWLQEPFEESEDQS